MPRRKKAAYISNEQEVMKELSMIEQERLDEDEIVKVEEPKEIVPRKKAKPSKKFGIVNAEKGLNLRSGPSMNDKILALLKNGEKVEVLGSSEQFYNVRSRDGKLGFVKKDFLDI